LFGKGTRALLNVVGERRAYKEQNPSASLQNVAIYFCLLWGKPIGDFLCYTVFHADGCIYSEATWKRDKQHTLCILLDAVTKVYFPIFKFASR
jgi:hypothetical protein